MAKHARTTSALHAQVTPTVMPLKYANRPNANPLNVKTPATAPMEKFAKTNAVSNAPKTQSASKVNFAYWVNARKPIAAHYPTALVEKFVEAMYARPANKIPNAPPVRSVRTGCVAVDVAPTVIAKEHNVASPNKTNAAASKALTVYQVRFARMDNVAIVRKTVIVAAAENSA